MSLFAKDLDYLEVSAADFLPVDNKLFIVVADSECNLYILQYDPEGKPYTAEKTPMLSFSNEPKTPTPPTATNSSTAANSTQATPSQP
jgi:hypothetical protein